MRPQSRRLARRGLTSMMAMIFLSMAAILALGMYAASTSATASAKNMIEGDRARNAAESGLRWVSWRFQRMTRPKTTIGSITPAVATSLWPSIRASIATDLNTMLTPGERPTTFTGNVLSSRPIAVDESAADPRGARFTLQVAQHPLFAGDPMDARYIRVISTGTYRSASRVLSMDFRIDKKVKFAIVGKVPIQLGRNTLVEGPIGMTTPNKFPPLYTLSDFRHLNATLAGRIDLFNEFLVEHHKGYDNRVNVHDPDEYALATQAGFSDYNGDSFIDEYDLFVKYYDKNADASLTAAEFTDPSTGKLFDPDLFNAIDGLGPPLYGGDPQRVGYRDGIIDNRDSYTKVRGQITLAASADAWETNLASQGKLIQDMIKGPIQPTDGKGLPIKFAASGQDLFDLTPTNFDTGSFRAKTGPENGITRTSGGAKVTIENKVLSAADTQVMTVTAKGNTTFNVGDVVLESDFDTANASLPSTQRATGTNVSAANAVERTPFGSTSYQATYSRPVFKNMHFKNVRIPKGMNALFDGCTFEGVTFVELNPNITTSTGQTTTSASDAMVWSKRMKSGSFSTTTALTAANSHGFEQGNNLRFNNCTMKGPIASDNPSAYSHFTNSMEFTGATMFNNVADQTATIVCPQTNIEMGSFTDPNQAPSTLVGVVVAGNIDIRGNSVVDGSIIVTGDGAGNTTQGWFGPSDASTDPSSPMPEGGWGRLSIVYNPNRPLPDGINMAIDLVPDVDSYTEGQ